MIICRVLEPIFDTKIRMIISGLGVGCFLLLFPSILLRKSREKEEQGGLALGLGLILAIAASIFLRTLNSTIDISTWSWFQVIGWILALIEAIMVIGWLKSETADNYINDTDTTVQDSREPFQAVKSKRVVMTALGLTSILFTVNFVFVSPVMISRWTEGNYIVIISIIILMLVFTAFTLSFKPELVSKLNQWILLAWNGLFFVSLVLTIMVNQIPFLSFPATSYPIIAPPATFLHLIPLVLMLFTFPIILIDFILLSREFMKTDPKPSNFTAGVSFSISGLYLIIMILALIFTSTWGFIPVIGVFFRDMFWFIFLIAGLTVIISLLHLPVSSLSFRAIKSSRTTLVSTGLIAIILVGTIMSAVIIEAHPVVPSGEVTSVKVMTYNLQQGVNEFAQKNYDGQLRVIREANADIIGLQETSKIAGNSDIVRYIANNLNLYSYFGPKGVTGTTGVALLSKYPIKNPRTIYHYSENIDQKQTATIEAEITIGSQKLAIYVTHTYGRTIAKEILQNDVLKLAEGKSNVIFLGDFNFRPLSSPYNLTTAVLNDSWLVKWPTGIQPGVEFNASRRIDHIFVSPSLNVTDSRFIVCDESDHPALWTEINWS
ncbi:MAG: endonuclease/exonuclease/phosphatase family protein [Candidatus Hodarchaeales archaeon]